MVRRFRSYLDPALVKHVLEHQEQPRFEGEVREMSVVFTDLEGYTATFEKLREGAVSLLNEYLGHMSRLIHEHNGYRHQFFGDGTMFFYGAPEHDPNHAIHAVETVLEMQEMIATLNESLATRRRQLCDDVTLAMRVGVSTGQMIVGDSGSEEASDYTVLGDAVNLGARLESANKVFGTRILITERTVELIPVDRFLIRPIGKLRVVGLSRAVMAYEPLADATKASDTHRKTAQLTRVMFECFRGADFDGCMSAVELMDRELGASRLSEVYRQLCDECLRKPPGPGFTGEIVLPTK